MTIEAETCAVCAYADAHGWWGPGVPNGATHCRHYVNGVNRGCHRTWTGKSEVHCPICHRHFSTGSVADACHKGDVCQDPATVLTKAGVERLKSVSRASGEVWVGAGTWKPSDHNPVSDPGNLTTQGGD